MKNKKKSIIMSIILIIVMLFILYSLTGAIFNFSVPTRTITGIVQSVHITRGKLPFFMIKDKEGNVFTIYIYNDWGFISTLLSKVHKQTITVKAEDHKSYYKLFSIDY